MPGKPARPCRKAGCNKLTTAKDGYCEKHTGLDKRKADEQRGTATERGYDGKWQKIRNRKLKENPLCERCAISGKVVVAELVHHKDHNPKKNNWENLVSLCNDCHEKEHKQERYRGRVKSS